MSVNEIDMIESGDVGFDGELFSGSPDFASLLSLPFKPLTAEEQAFIDGPVEKLCAETDEWQVTLNKQISEETWDYLKSKKFFGILIPKQYGGLGFSHNAFSIIVKRLISRAFTVGATALIPNSLGAVGLLLKHGTKEQKEYYLPRFATGEEIPAFAMTGPTAGCDLEHLPDIGYVEYGLYNNENVLGIRVSWEKRYITLAPVATVIQVGFQTVRDGQHIGITCALIPTNLPGVTTGRRHWPARQNFMNGPTTGKDVFIPMSMVIGGEPMLGRGWKMTMEQLHGARAFSIPSLGTAAAQYTARHVGAYARLREQFGRSIGKFEGVQSKLAEIAADAFMLECARKVTMATLDNGTTPAVISAIMKYQSTDRARSAVINGMDILGGRGIFEGPKNFLFPIYQMMPIIITVEGANILTRSFIVFGHGLLRSHKHLADLYKSIYTSNESQFIKSLLSYVMHFLYVSIKLPIQNLVYFFSSKRSLQFYIKHTSTRFAFLGDVALMVYSGSLKRRERISGCFSDILSEMYLTGCVLRYAKEFNDSELTPLLIWIYRRSENLVNQRIKEIIDNMPTVVLRAILRFMVFTFGSHAPLPNSAADKEVAGMILTSGKLRELITDGVYVSFDEKDKTGCLEAGLKLVEKGEGLPIDLLRRIIDVDDFSMEELAKL